MYSTFPLFIATTCKTWRHKRPTELLFDFTFYSYFFLSFTRSHSHSLTLCYNSLYFCLFFFRWWVFFSDCCYTQSMSYSKYACHFEISFYSFIYLYSFDFSLRLEFKQNRKKKSVAFSFRREWTIPCNGKFNENRCLICFYLLGGFFDGILFGVALVLLSCTCTNTTQTFQHMNLHVYTFSHGEKTKFELFDEISQNFRLAHEN